MDSDSPHSDNMAALVANTQPQQNGGPNRRYRPAPAKTFQCRGYGDCRMVFSRSEHLARHIRKHTGERPFTCHCSKQFSRLDNLRQHAQTVHADKQDANERMMRELSSLHATMAAANKATQQRGKRGAQQAPPVSVSLSTESLSDTSGDAPASHRVQQQQHQHGGGGTGGGNNVGGGGGEGVKQEDTQPTLSLVSQRPGTSTGYEGDTDLFHHHHSSAASRSWYVQDADRSHPRHVSSHSFRDSVQSFRAPSAASPASPASSTSPTSATPTSPPSAHTQHPGQSFLASGESFVELGVSDLPASSWSTANRADIRPSSSSSRPPTASRESTDSHPRSLPPLSAIVSSSLPPSQWGSVPSQSFFPIQSGPGIVPARPSTATRPGTAPASYYASPPFGGFGGGSGLVLSAATANPYGLSELVRSSSGYGSTDASDSPVGGGYDSPFSFHPPSLPNESIVSRKRPFSGLDDDDRERLGSSAGGSESRPQSRRLSVMELCNDIDADPATRPFLPLSAVQGGAGSTSRPNTASTSLAALAIADAPTPFEQQYRHQSPAQAQAQQQARAEAQSQARAHAQAQQQQDEFSPSTPTSSNTTNSVHPYSATSYQHLQYFGVEQQQHLLHYEQSQAEAGQGQARTPPQGQVQGQTQAHHAGTGRPTLVVNAPIKYDSRSLLPTPPLHLG
ncbi:hypothetical protein EI94DRAFT_1833091 [Lactarius quietus]|nr:hypothetical protein EI94DRAFT_1833091 [Lactarius quietus]